MPVGHVQKQGFPIPPNAIDERQGLRCLGCSTGALNSIGNRRFSRIVHSVDQPNVDERLRGFTGLHAPVAAEQLRWQSGSHADCWRDMFLVWPSWTGTDRMSRRS